MTYYNERMVDTLHDKWLEPPEQEEVVTNVRMTIEIDFSYDGDMRDMDEVEEYLEEALESGAESTCSTLRLIKIVKADQE